MSYCPLSRMGDASRISQQTAGPRPHPSVGPEVRLADGWGRRTNLAQVLRVNKLGKRQEKVAILCSPWMCMDWGRATVPVRQRKCLEAQGCSASSTGARIKDRQVLHRHWMEEVSRTPPPPPARPLCIQPAQPALVIRKTQFRITEGCPS